jgi:hypothetical protein
VLAGLTTVAHGIKIQLKREGEAVANDTLNLGNLYRVIRTM